MENKDALAHINASRVVASAWGVLAGLGGLTHGVGEVLQGNVMPDGVVIFSWIQGPIATNLGGEPAMTIIPNLLVTGVLTIIVSLAVMVWAAAFVQRKNGGMILIFLSVGMLLVGGGFAPPLIGIISGWAGTGINSPLIWWRTRLPISLQRWLARLWPWLFIICLLASVLLVIGSVILVYFFGINNADFFSNLFLFVLVLLLVIVVAGFAYDIQNN
jgi:hypothetical protein